MKKIILFFVMMLVVFSTSPVYGHKLISHDDSHKSFKTALNIPDHKISWAIYENLEANEAKFYTFEGKQGDSFYAGIVIPKIQGLENYSPSLIIMHSDTSRIIEKSFAIDWKSEKFLYEDNFPGFEFYEPFGQVTYWERQEVKLELPYDGRYFIVVSDEKSQQGKYSLAVGTIENFSGIDFITILPKAWLDTKLFVDDFGSIAVFFSLLIMILVIPIFVKIKKKRKNESIV